MCLNTRRYLYRNRRKRDVCISARWDKPMRKRVQPRNRMRENCTSGTVWGVPGNRHSYHDLGKIDVMNMTRWIFSLSFTIGMFWLLGFLLEPIGQEEPSILTLSVLSVLVGVIFSFCLFKRSPNFLKTYPESYIS